MKLKSIVMTFLVLCATLLQVSVASAMNSTSQIDSNNTTSHHQKMQHTQNHDCCNTSDESVATTQHEKECKSQHCSFTLLLIDPNKVKSNSLYSYISFPSISTKPIPTVSFILRPPKHLA
ncbi:hypothetical protein [Marinicellulosiphila megalodicopiae]|uniref:hypothetical protein n=1 Tax=Marinicellulosiphila megalodicopiae TaxID=2724896 RepID=UPI003BB0AE22